MKKFITKSVLFSMLLLTGGLSNLISNNLCAQAMVPESSTSKPYINTKSEKRKCLIVVHDEPFFGTCAQVYVRKNSLRLHGINDQEFDEISLSQKYNLNKNSVGSTVYLTYLSFKSKEDLHQFIEDYKDHFIFEYTSMEHVYEEFGKPIGVSASVTQGDDNAPNSRRVLINLAILGNIAFKPDIPHPPFTSEKRPCRVVLNTSYIPVSVSGTSCPFAQVWIKNDTIVKQDNFIFDREFFEICLAQKCTCVCDFILSTINGNESCLLLYSKEDLDKFTEHYKDRFTFTYSKARDINIFELIDYLVMP